MQWRVLITLAGVDVSARLTGEVMIDAEENAAAIAEFTLLPEPGPINADQWIGAAVIIESVVDEAPPERLFTGTVDVPKYDIQTGLTRFQCTDGLQQRFEAMTRNEIDGKVAGYWSPYVFDARADGWEYAQDRMSTNYYSFDADRFGDIGYFYLMGGQGPDFVFDDSNYVAGSLEVDLPSHRDLINRVDLTIECRYTVFLETQANVSWGWPYKPGDAPGWPVPSPSAAQSAAASVGYLNAFSYQEFPATGLFEIASWNPASSVDIASGNFVSWVNERPSETCFSFSAIAARRAAVEVTWKAHYRYELTESINRYGVCSKDETVSFDMTAPSPEGWERFESDAVSPDWPSSLLESKPLLPVSFDIKAYRKAYYTLRRLHHTDVLRAHRARVRFDVAFKPGIDRHKFVRLDSSQVTASGKVFRYVHRLNTEAGTAVTELILAPNMCSSAGNWTGVDFPEPLPTKSTEFNAVVTFESHDPMHSGDVGFQVNADAPDLSPYEFVFSGSRYVSTIDGRPVHVEGITSDADELVIHGRSV